MSAVDTAIGAVGAVAAVYAAFYSKRSFRSSSQAAKVADARRLGDVRPHLSVVSVNYVDGASGVSVRLQNAGGAVPEGLIVAASERTTFAGVFALPEHTNGEVTLTVVDAPPASTTPSAQLTPRVKAAVGRDIDSQWWDLLTERRISTPPMPPTSADFPRWAEAEASRHIGEPSG